MPSASATRVRADMPRASHWPQSLDDTHITRDHHHAWTLTCCTEATREEMSAARLPLAYRDSCAHLLIPLNRCRHEEYYLPWKCEVPPTKNPPAPSRAQPRLTHATERAPHLRKVPVRGVQAARRQDGRAQGRQERAAKQLELARKWEKKRIRMYIPRQGTK